MKRLDFYTEGFVLKCVISPAKGNLRRCLLPAPKFAIPAVALHGTSEEESQEG